MRFLVGIFIACLWASSAFAQAGVVVNYRNSGNQATEVSPSNPLPVSGSFSASLAPFQPSASGARGTPLSVTTSDSSGSLPTGAAVVVSNAGANLMYCNVNAVAATTSDQPITANDGWFVFTIPSGVTTLHCIATGGSTTANTVGGTGLPAGTGGGSGGGGSGGTAATDEAAFTPGTTSYTPMGGTYIASPSALSTGNGAAWRLNQYRAGEVDVDTTNNNLYGVLSSMLTGIQGPIPCLNATAYNTNTYTTGQTNPANCDVNGNLYTNGGINRWAGTTLGAPSNFGTTPGAVSSPGVNASLFVGTVAASSGAGAVGTGTARVAVGQDSTTVAGSAPGTAGTPSANVVSVQGVSSMTPILVTPSAAADPCSSGAKTNLPISFQATSSAQLIALSGTTKIYVCSLSLIASVATVFSITGGTGTNCGTPAALIGTTSASNGLSLAANGGLTYGNGGGTVAVTGAGSELCIVQSGGGNLVGNLTYVQQ